MSTRDEAIQIRVGDQRIAGMLVAPGTLNPGVLFVHGWGGSQENYLARARQIAALGCVCLTFNLRGHAETEPQHVTVTREENLRDLVAAYDVLARQPLIDKEAIAVVGSSYGGYLAAILTALRPVRWLALRVPALYRDEDWALPKQQLKKYGLAAYRRLAISPDENDVIAGFLNRNGLKTGPGNRWTRERVTALRSSYRIPLFREAPGGAEPWLNLSQAAALIGIAARTLRLAAERGEIEAKHPLEDGPWIFSRTNLDSSAVRALVLRTKGRATHPAVPDPAQQSLFSSRT